MRYLVDSNIVIYHLNSEPIATDFLIKNYSKIAISLITYIEVLSFNFNLEDEKKVKKLLNSFKILNIDKKISNQAIINRKQNRIKLPDNLILSTAMLYDLILVTRNIKDFKNFDIKTLNIFQD